MGLFLHTSRLSIYILGRDTGIVATCGGETVCLIDCSTGKVMKRFKQQQEVIMLTVMYFKV